MFALEFGQVAAMASAEAPPSGRAASPESESAPGRSAPAGATAESLALGDIDESVDEAQGSGRASFGSQQGASHGASSKSDNPLEA